MTRESGVTLDLTQLNPDQRDAVEYASGPLLIVAGAGSGKTRVLTYRVAHLIATGTHPMNVLAITFTNKAAEEMRSRVKSLVGEVADRMWVSTFHSACVRILRSTGDRLGYPKSFTIYDSADSQRLIAQVIRDLNLDPKRYPAKGAQVRISLWKNELVDAAGAAEAAFGPFETKYAEIFKEYQHRLMQAGAMDFDDLLVNVVKLFRTHPDVLASYQERFKHVLVDEYQDTNSHRTRSCCCSGVRTTTCASWATPTSRSTPSAGPTTATSCSSSVRSPTCTPWCSRRTTAARRTSSMLPMR